MAVVLKVSEKEWAKKGLPAEAYQAILSKGYQVVHKPGGGWSFSKGDELTGVALMKGAGMKPDWAFDSKYKELTGLKFDPKPFLAKKQQQGGTVTGSMISPIPGAASPMQKPKAPSGDSKFNGIPTLTEVEEVGVAVQGTGKIYRSYLISDDANIAFRLAGGQLSIRAERFTPEAKKAIAAWGMDVKTGKDRPYASAHVNVGTQDVAVRTLGSLAMSFLTAPPKKMLAKNKVTI